MPEIQTATACAHQVPPDRGNVQPLLHEIRHAVNRFLSTGDTHVIDLRSIPMAPGEEAQIEDCLGRGEVVAVLNALGRSEVRETVYPGVWLIVHQNTADEIIGKFIEITDIPSILKSQLSDVRAGVARLTALLEED